MKLPLFTIREVLALALIPCASFAAVFIHQGVFLLTLMFVGPYLASWLARRRHIWYGALTNAVGWFWAFLDWRIGLPIGAHSGAFLSNEPDIFEELAFAIVMGAVAGMVARHVQHQTRRYDEFGRQLPGRHDGECGIQ